LGVTLPCLSPCEPDPEDTTTVPPEIPSSDKCKVNDANVGEVWRTCVPIVNQSSLRSEIGKRRAAQGILLNAQVVEMEIAIQKIHELEERHKNHKEAREQ